ncbi:hypothetical protein BIW11_08935 [Tropilaelaps mercedesae]|uniref:Uncharacterized protein n=1 Tax=Tropilaelaps mercedesae TaxID=418985 RepID=A0A1V9XMC5_9ACAR|nr:hypothetical protein BIW11_08935 [Tropilaelaps mercedesae]
MCCFCGCKYKQCWRLWKSEKCLNKITSLKTTIGIIFYELRAPLLRYCILQQSCIFICGTLHPYL